MAYQLTKSRKYVENLELVDEEGKVIKVIHVEIGAGKIAENLSQKYVEMLKCKRNIDQMSIKAKEQISDEETVLAYTQLGEIVVDMMKIVFGEENTKEILEFYENDYLDIVQQVVPFIVNVILPQVRAISQENRKKILQQYNRRSQKNPDNKKRA